MALKPCPECGHEVSQLADNCPNCGYPLKATSSPSKEEAQKPARPTGSSTLPRGAYEYHTVNVRAMKWNVTKKLDEIREEMSEAGWEFVSQRELPPPSTSGLDRQVEVTFRRVKVAGSPPPPVRGAAWGCLVTLMPLIVLGASITLIALLFVSG